MYKLYQRLTCLSIICLYAMSPLHGQQAPLDSLKKKFDRHRKYSLQEKVYVHSDQNFYVTGETLWFKAYLVDGTFHKPLGLSKIVYVEILDRNNTSVLHAKVQMKDGFGSGSLFIPATISSGSYTLRAYTSWMKNFNAAFFFHKPITIVNTFVSNDVVAAAKKTYKVEFFPEGGRLVQGLTSKVGFKVTDNNGIGVSCSGAVLNANNDTLVTFKSARPGIGHFIFTPSSGGNERVVITDTLKASGSYALPVAADRGYAMTVKDMGNTLEVVINHKDVKTESFIYLFAHSRQVVAYAEAKLLLDKPITFTIAKTLLTDGITHITLFDDRITPLCERLYFKFPSQKLTVSATADNDEFETRKKVNLKINTSLAGRAVPANVSVSVYKLDSLSEDQPNGIFDYLWLSSDLTGKIEASESYFSDHADSSNAIDNLMLTHGWRRFNWDNILNRKEAHSYPLEYRGHIITGNVSDEDGKPSPGSLVWLSSPGKITRIFPARSNATGRVHFETLDLWGPRQLVMRATDSMQQARIENPLSEEFTAATSPPFYLSPALEETITSRSIAMQVQDVYQDKIRERYRYPPVDSTGFYGKADETYLLDDYTRFPVMEEVMREYVPGVFVRKRRDGFHFIVIDNVNKTVMQETPLILLDGVPLFDADEIMKFDPRKVKKLEIVTRPYHLATQTFQGVVSYTTYRGDLGGFRLDPKYVVMDFEGLHLQREFPAPRYESQKQYGDRTPDQRYLLLWAPQVVTDAQGNQQLEFYTSDIQGRFMVKVEGITQDGIAGSGSIIFNVKRLDH